MIKYILVILLISVGCSASFTQNKVVDSSQVTILIDTSCGSPFIESQLFQWLQARVTKILSGNEIEVMLKDSCPVIVRLQAIETLPLDKPFGLEAKQYLENRALQQDVDLTVRRDWMPKAKPLISHVLAIVHLRKVFEDLNYSMLCLGLAKYQDPEPYSMSSYDQCIYKKASKAASDKSLGVWSVAP